MDSAKITEMFDLAGKVAFVTGGAVGNGKAAGLALAAAGAKVVLADDADRIEQYAVNLPSGVETVELDVTSEASVKAVVADVIARHGGIDILVNGAVINHNKPFLDMTLEDWDQVQSINARSGFLVCQAVIPSMQKRGGGRIISLTTIGSVHPVLNGNGAYGPSRAALNHLMRNIALDFAADHITANSVLPGAIVTETISAGMRPTGPGADPARQLGGYGKPDDVAGLVLLLAGPSGRYISGQAIAVDGGFLIS